MVEPVLLVYITETDTLVAVEVDFTDNTTAPVRHIHSIIQNLFNFNLYEKKQKNKKICKRKSLSHDSKINLHIVMTDTIAFSTSYFCELW